MHYFLRKIKHILVLFAVITYILFEELVWNKIAEPVYNFLKNIKFYELFLSYIHISANRYTVLLLFIMPFVAGEFLGILSAVLAASTHILFAIVVYALKIPLVIIAFAILKAGDSKLESFIWFSTVRRIVVTIMEKIKSSTAYQKIKQLSSHIKYKISLSKSTFKELVIKTYNKAKHRN